MKVISVRQPHASLIMAGIKTIETRSFKTKIRGPILIHSSFTWAKTDEELERYLDKVDFKGRIKRYLYEPALMPAGYILGAVELVDVIQAGDWIEANRMKGGNEDYVREWALGDLSSDRYAWILKDPRPFDKPIEAKGRLGFWDHSVKDIV
jgi:hypothetical protein